MSNASDLITLAVIILIPIVPAYVLFRGLPATASVEGTFHGFGLKLTGAFAGYFGVLLLVFYLRDAWAPASPYQVWQVFGELLDENGEPLEALRQDQFQVAPAVFVNHGGGKFEVTVITQPGPMGHTQYPTLNIAYSPYNDVPINLDGNLALGAQGDIQFSRDEANHIFKVSPIRLKKKLPQYEDRGVPPPLAPGGGP